MPGLLHRLPDVDRADQLKAHLTRPSSIHRNCITRARTSSARNFKFLRIARSRKRFPSWTRCSLEDEPTAWVASTRLTAGTSIQYHLNRMWDSGTTTFRIGMATTPPLGMRIIQYMHRTNLLELFGIPITIITFSIIFVLHPSSGTKPTVMIRHWRS